MASAGMMRVSVKARTGGTYAGRKVRKGQTVKAMVFNPRGRGGSTAKIGGKGTAVFSLA